MYIHMLSWCRAQRFDIGKRSSEGQERQTVAADLDGTIVRSGGYFPYFVVVAMEGGSLLHRLVLLASTPLI